MKDSGDRCYWHEKIILRRNTVEKLKELNVLYPTVICDRKFVKELLYDIFGFNVLRKSSFGGGIARNTGKAHQALNKHKLIFVEG